SVGYYGIRDAETGERHLRAALEITSRLYRAHPDNPECQCQYAGCCVHLASVLFQKDRTLPEIGPLAKQAQELVEPASGSPRVGVSGYEMVLGQMCWLRGSMAAAMNRRDEAKALFRRCIDSYETLLRVQPKSFPYLFHLSPAYMALAQLLEKSQPEE